MCRASSHTRTPTLQPTTSMGTMATQAPTKCRVTRHCQLASHATGATTSLLTSCPGTATSTSMTLAQSPRQAPSGVPPRPFTAYHFLLDVISARLKTSPVIQPERSQDTANCMSTAMLVATNQMLMSAEVIASLPPASFGILHGNPLLCEIAWADCCCNPQDAPSPPGLHLPHDAELQPACGAG